MNETNHSTPKFELDHPRHPSKKPLPTKLVTIIIAISTVVAIGIIVLIVMLTPCDHQWEKATCIEPRTCTLCGKSEGDTKKHSFRAATCTTSKTCRVCKKEEGVPKGHNFAEATCITPKMCLRCDKIKGKALGHIKSKWTLTKEATLINVGIEEIHCSICDEILDSRKTDKKAPNVIGSSFNFTDDEFIDWINDLSTANVGYTDIGIFDTDSTNTSYRITMSDSEAGALLLNHGNNGKNGDIQAIMIYFDNDDAAAAMAIWLGEKIDSDFDSDDAILKVAYGESYTAADMTVCKIELDDDFIVTILAPSEYIADILS